jgi:hypothetical protein
MFISLSLVVYPRSNAGKSSGGQPLWTAARKWWESGGMKFRSQDEPKAHATAMLQGLI